MLKSLLQIVFTVALFFLYGIDAATTHYSESNIDYQVFKSTIDPNYSIRFISPKLCDPNVTQVLQFSFRLFLLTSKAKN
jgi:hypothetical protein